MRIRVDRGVFLLPVTLPPLTTFNDSFCICTTVGKDFPYVKVGLFNSSLPLVLYLVSLYFLPSVEVLCSSLRVFCEGFLKTQVCADWKCYEHMVLVIYLITEVIMGFDHG